MWYGMLLRGMSSATPEGPVAFPFFIWEMALGSCTTGSFGRFILYNSATEHPKPACRHKAIEVTWRMGALDCLDDVTWIMA